MSIGRFLTPTLSSRRRAAGAVLAAATLGLLGCQGDDENLVQTLGAVADLGSESGRITLPAAATLGQRAEGSIEMAMKISGSTGARSETIEITMAFDVAREVVDVDDDGGYVTREVWTDVEITSTNSEVGREMTAAFPDQFGVDTSIDGDGNVVAVEVVDDGSLSAEQRETAKQIADDAGSVATLLFPAEPVGAGARWSTASSQTTNGMEFALTMDNELIELTDDRYTVDTSIDDEMIDEMIDGERLTGTVTGSGSVTGSTQNPLVSTGSMSMTIDMRGAGMSMEVSIDVDADLTEPV